jgi:hypothetical protein
MKSSLIFKATLILIVASLNTGAYGFELKVPKLNGGSSGSASTENPGEVVKNARNSMASFVKAKLGLIEAMGGSEELAAQQKLIEGLKKGDAAATKEDLETIVSLDKATGDMIKKKTAENTVIESKNKQLAGKSMVEYVKGVVATKQLMGSISKLSSNPMSLGSSATSVIYLAKELPSVISSGTSTTSTLFTYMKSSGIDTGDAKKAAADLGV